jgi:hypothetical protein
MQMEFVSRIIDLAPDIIKAIEDNLRVTARTVGIIKDHFSQLIEAFLSVEW